MDKTVEEFYSKNPEENYFNGYKAAHSPRMLAVIARFGLNNVHGRKLIDFGGGRSEFFSYLPQDNEFTTIDGANLKIPDDLYCKKTNYLKLDLNLDLKLERKWDTAFCMECCEHVPNLYQLLCNIKNAVAINGDIYITIPDEGMWHNVIYYNMFYPQTNFEEFMLDMAMPVQDKFLYNKGWPSWCYRLRNLEWKNKRMRFYKAESKFRSTTLLEDVNI